MAASSERFTPDYLEMPFDLLAGLASGTVVYDAMEDGIRFVILRGPVALCAYLGVPSDHPLAGMNYDDMAVECHGGLTFSGAGGDFLPSGRYWYGWDYGHAGDVSFYDLRPGGISPRRAGDTAWTVKAVVSDSWSALYSFKKMIALAEAIRTGLATAVSKARGGAQ